MKKNVIFLQDNIPSLNWQQHNPVSIVFGEDSIKKLPELIGKGKILLLTTAGFTKRGVTEQVCQLLGRDNVFVFDDVQPNPSFSEITSYRDELNKLPIKSIVAVGGGSVIDTAKALSIALSCRSNDFSLRRLLDGKIDLAGKDIVPLIATPTTAGTGSEVTPFSTIWDKKAKRKYSLATPQIYPCVAVLDPVLTLSLPEEETIATGLDALSHAFEAIWNKNATPITDLYAKSALKTIFTALPEVVSDKKNIINRTRMMKASLFSGLAISQTRTALSHSISYPLTAHFGMPHGLACAFTLPALIEFNAKEDKRCIAEIACSLGFASIAELYRGVIRLYRDIGVVDLFKVYVSRIDDLLKLSSQMFDPDRAGNNLRNAGLKDVQKILMVSWNMVSDNRKKNKT